MLIVENLMLYKMKHNSIIYKIALKKVLRSLSAWSGGFLDSNHVEQSIHEAYIDTITRAQHYIYIENQFFIALSLNNPNTRNQVGEALFNRILRAFKWVFCFFLSFFFWVSFLLVGRKKRLGCTWWCPCCPVLKVKWAPKLVRLCTPSLTGTMLRFPGNQTHKKFKKYSFKYF